MKKDMAMITLEKFKKMFLYNVDGKCCIEVELFYDNNSFFVGKSADSVYWCGAPYSFESEDFDKFFKFLESMWDGIEVIAIDGCDPSERIDFYLK